MPRLTRRDLLKAGLAVSASALTTSTVHLLPSAAAATENEASAEFDSLSDAAPIAEELVS